MKKMLLVPLLLVAMISCHNSDPEFILKNFKNGPTKELFKVYHFLYKKEYEVNIQEGVSKYQTFKQNLKTNIKTCCATFKNTP